MFDSFFLFPLPWHRSNKFISNYNTIDMKEITIKCDTRGEVDIDDNARTNGISIALVNEKSIPVAKYEFDSKKISNIIKLSYEANNVRIHFYGDITPSMRYELTSASSK